MENATNIVSVSWGDHLVFGEGNGRLDSYEALEERMIRWRDDLGATIIQWRTPTSKLNGRHYKARGYPRTIEERQAVELDFSHIVPQMAHELKMRAYLYVSIFDEGRPLLPKKIREVSYHNAMHGQHISWQSDFSRRHPEYAITDRSGKIRQWGVLCLAYPEVRRHLRQRFERLLDGTDFDGLFVCLRSQSRPADFADQYGFNDPIRRDYLRLYDRDIRKEDFDIQLWRDLMGEYLTGFLGELRRDLDLEKLRLSVGCARGDVLGPPLGNTTLQWREWIQQGIIDELVINQNSSQCPSMWHHLWPMHRGNGYLQNYIDGYNLPQLNEHMTGNYAPALRSNMTTKFYIARQWDEPSKSEEEALLSIPGVSGLVFSSFRFDNPEAVTKGNWVA
ncbi:MAG: hypothetical protein V3U24_11630 [Candidatus Neomarinimicrobiota bacterium]